MPNFEQQLPTTGEKLPIEFIEKVKEVFPDWDRMNGALDNSLSPKYVETYLNDTYEEVSAKLEAKNIINAFAEGKQNEVLEAAEMADKLTKLRVELTNILES